MTPNDVKIVADNISDFIEVPDGIERLRKAVLTLAVAGKLAPQDKKEISATDLFVQIQTECKNKKKGIITLEKVPFDIPNSWKWVRLGDLGRTETGSTPKQTGERFNGGTIPFVRPDNIKSLFISEARDRLTEADLKNGGTQMPGGSLLMVCIGSIGKVGVAYQNVSFNQQINAISPYSGVLVEYLLYASASGYFQEFAWKLSSKTTLPILNKSKWESIPIPLPPFAEQKRIVKRVEELMKQLNELEVKKLERDEKRTRLARSAMQALGKGESKIAFKHLTDLVQTPADLKELEGALLTLAVSGQLVSQNKKDGTGEDLFNKIQLSKAKVKKQITIEEKDKLFPIPSSWSWVRLEDVFDVRDGTHDSPKYHTSGYPLVTSKNLYYGKLDFLNVKYVSEVDYKKINERSKVDRDDILFAMIGSIGNPVIVDTDAEFSIKNVALFKYYSHELSEPNFLLTYLKYASQNMRAVSAGGVQSFVSLGFLREYPFPLPPLDEQRRIVKKVEEVMLLVNKLKSLVAAEK